MERLCKNGFTAFWTMALIIVHLYMPSLLAQEVMVTPTWLDFYGIVLDVESQNVVVGTLVQAYDADGVLCGEFVVQTAGEYGFMPVYGDDPLTPEVDEGASEGDSLFFVIDGRLASLMESNSPIWTTNTEKLNVDLMSPSQTGHQEGENESLPSTFALHQNYPNPFNAGTIIRYEVPESAGSHRVKIEIHNAIGENIKTLVDEYQQAGVHSVQWDGRNDMDLQVSSGIYLYRFIAGSFVQSRKMLYLR